ncbi:MAG: mechanosensitive ion channel [Candidatus Sumerlaeaceae bacterium]|nr:mechanosensitive ion channel [Candidatus Sumerlaeaceae bacterium]
MMKSIIFTGLILSVTLGAVAAPDRPSPADLSTTPPLTSEAIETRIRRLESEPQLLAEAGLTTQVLAEYRAAAEAIREAAEWSKRADDFEAAVNAAPQALADARQRLDAKPVEDVSDLPATPTLQQAEQTQRALKAALDAARKRADELAAEQSRRAERQSRIPALLAEAQEQRNAAESQLRAVLGIPQESLAVAKATAAAARLKAAEQKDRALKAEQAAYIAEADLPTVQRDLVLREIESLSARLDALQTLLADLRRRQAAQSAMEARAAAEELIGAHPAVRAIAAENERLAQARTGPQGVTERIAQAETQYKKARENLERVRQDFAAARERIKAAGLNQVVGVILRAQRDKLPDTVRLKRSINERQRALPESQLLLIELQDKRARLASLDSAVKTTVAATGADPTTTAADQLTSLARELLTTQRNYLDSLIADTTVYFTVMADLDAAERQLLAETEIFARFIDEQVLWIRSSPPFGISQLGRIGQLAVDVASSDELLRVVTGALRHAARSPAALLTVVLTLLLIAAIPARIGKHLARTGETVRLSASAPTRVTLQALAATLLLAARWPALLGVTAWLITGAPDSPEVADIAGAALRRLAYVIFGFEAVRLSCSPGGLAAAHFGWPEAALQQLRAAIPRLFWVYLPAVFLYQFARWHGSETVRREQLDAVGQAALFAAMAALSIFLFRILHPTRGIFSSLLAAQSGGWLSHLRYVWYPAIAGAPLVMAALALAGYDYAAAVLALKFQITLGLGAILIIAHGFAARGLMVARLHFAQRRSREHAEVTAAAEGAAPAAGETLYTELAVADTQSRRLLRLITAGVFLVSVWFVWVDVLPALGYLHRPEFRLWTYTAKVTEVTRDATGEERRQVVERMVPVTVGSVLLALLVVGITFVAARNLPGLLEVAVLSRLPIQAGGRYAASQLARYVIVFIGILASAGILGVGWSDVQWLAAAATVGLAFGLQEIFGNFVSGLILLFERPVRVGDVVTINNVTGRVTRIRMRATTILDWDNREHIVPNKTLITGEIVNWTLTDSVARLEFRVGVAYGSDPDVVRELLLRAARETPGVLTDPAPHALLDGFGDNSLQFVMRCFIPKLDISLATRHEIQRRISELFAEAGVVIPVPQREVRVIRAGGDPFDEKRRGTRES